MLVPFLVTVMSVVLVSSLVNAALHAQAARRSQEEDLARLVNNLTDAGFPLTTNVLRQMSGLSGAEFVVLTRSGQVEATTLEQTVADVKSFLAVPESRRWEGLAAQPSLMWQGRTYLVVRLPVRQWGKATDAQSLLVLYPEDRWTTIEREALAGPLWVGLGAVLVVAAVTTILARRFAAPIGRLREQARRIAAGDFQPGPISGRDDEIRDLTLSLNHLASQLSHYEEQIRRNERLRTLGQLGGGIAHQLRNSVTGALLALELYQRMAPPSGDVEALDVVHQQLQLMQTYLQRFLTLGRRQAAPPRRIAFADLIDDVLMLVKPTLQHHRVALDYPSPHEPGEISGDPDALRQLLVNLLLNAVEAAAQPGAPAPRVQVALLSGARELRLTIRDNGPGPAAAVQERLFEPFVSEKPEGTGLGLVVARQIVEEHGGSLTWRRDDGQTCFEVVLPRAEAASDPSSDPSSAAASQLA